MESNPLRCTLTDSELSEKAQYWIDSLVKSGGKAFVMHVPARPNEDPDLIFAELDQRFLAKCFELASLKAQPGGVWAKAKERLPEPFKVVPCKYTPDSPDPRKDTELHWGFVSKEGVWSRLWQNHQVEWYDESAVAIQIDREWIINPLVDFALSYHCSNNKDIANDAAEYLYDKLKDAGIEYVLPEDESAVGKESDAVEFAEWLYQNRWFSFENNKWHYTFE